jgi:hypothetical protein
MAEIVPTPAQAMQELTAAKESLTEQEFSGPVLPTLHPNLVKIVQKHAHNPMRMLGAMVAYLKHGPPHFIRIADAVEYAVKNEVELMRHQKSKGQQL